MAQTSSESSHDGGGRLKIFLGYAPGVGKTYAMLDESQRRKMRGADVIVGAVNAHDRPATEKLLEIFEHAPKKVVEIQGQRFEEMDVDAIIKRNPTIVLVDDLAHTNAPGSENQKRWQDIQKLLKAGISVLATLDVSNLESLNDKISEIIGHHVRDTVPDSVLREADEVEMVDLTPRALIHRLERGDLFGGDKVEDSRMHLFDEGKLSALRELALREIAGRVDEDVEEYRRERRVERPWAAHDRVLICISPSRPCLRLIRRGWRIAQRMHAGMECVFVENGTLNEKEQRSLQDDFALAERLSITTKTLKGDIATELVRYAKESAATHIVLGHSERTRLQEILHGSIIGTLARELKSVDIMIVASGETSQ